MPSYPHIEEYHAKLLRGLADRRPGVVQDGNEAMRVDMSRVGELHRLIRIFLDYELPEIQEFRHAQSQFKTHLPTVLENLRDTVAGAEADNPDYQEAAASFLDLCRMSRAIGCWASGVSMVSENVRLSGQRKCHLYCSR